MYRKPLTKTEPTFFWHDYETSGLDKARDRPIQFAGQRTTLDLEPVGEPVMFYGSLPADVLPDPAACILTGISPNTCDREGLSDAAFAREVNRHLGHPATCGVGYNTLRFDDEFSRHLLYRNFYDPYEREWNNGNSRWDLIDLARACYAMRPEGIVWPERDGAVSMRLEDLADANGLVKARAHDALSDVQTTIAFAKKIRDVHPELFHLYFSLRKKQNVLAGVDLVRRLPLFHVSGLYGKERGYASLVIPLAMHPLQPNVIITYDLMADPKPLLELSQEDLANHVFKAKELGVERVPLTTVYTNRVPFLVPIPQAQGIDLKRLGLDKDRCSANWKILSGATEAARRAQAIYGRDMPSMEGVDAELALYAGFPSENDKRLLAAVRQATPQELASGSFPFLDPRYTELLFRYRARNWPESLDSQERTRWDVFCQQQMAGTSSISARSSEAFLTTCRTLREDPSHADKTDFIDEVEAWGKSRIAAVAPSYSRPRTI